MRPAVHRKSHPASQAPGWLFAFRELWSSETNNWNEDCRYAAGRMDWPFVVARFPINNAAIYWFACAPSSTGVCWLALWHRTILTAAIGRPPPPMARAEVLPGGGWRHPPLAPAAGDAYAAAAAGRAKTVCVVARHAPRLEAIVAMRDQDTIS